MPINLGSDLNFPEIGRGLAAVRATEALLRTMGGSTVHVRVPAQVLAAGDGGQLGIDGPPTQDVALAPVVVRNASLNRKAVLGDERNRLRTELLIPASSLQTREVHDAATAKEFFTSALGVIVRGKLLRVESFAADEYGSVPYLYRVVVSE
jgi:hypothetical protein